MQRLQQPAFADMYFEVIAVEVVEEDLREPGRRDVADRMEAFAVKSGSGGGMKKGAPVGSAFRVLK